MSQPQQVEQPLHTFSAQLKRVTENGASVGWEFRVSRSSFPNTEFQEGSTTSFVLDGNKYAKSFESYKTFLQSLGVTELPSSLLEYTVSSSSTEIVVRGLTETTVRVAVVDMVTKSNGNVKLTMTRPEVTFRVYKAPEETEESFDGFVGMFGDNADY